MTRKYVRALKLHGILEIEAMKSNQPSPRETICKFQETMLFLKKKTLLLRANTKTNKSHRKDKHQIAL